MAAFSVRRIKPNRPHSNRSASFRQSWLTLVELPPGVSDRLNEPRTHDYERAFGEI